MNSPELHNCFECDQEFSVEAVFDEETEVAFCPYCGSSLEEIEDEDEEGLTDEEADDFGWTA